MSQQQKNQQLLLEPNDIVCGRGKDSFNHPGNHQFRQVISAHLTEYMQLNSRHKKTAFIVSIVRKLQNEYGARFVTKKRTSDDVCYYKEVSEKQAREKVGHSLRDTAVSKQCKPSKKEWSKMKKNQHKELPKHQEEEAANREGTNGSAEQPLSESEEEPNACMINKKDTTTYCSEQAPFGDQKFETSTNGSSNLLRLSNNFEAVLNGLYDLPLLPLLSDDLEEDISKKFGNDQNLTRNDKCTDMAIKNGDCSSMSHFFTRHRSSFELWEPLPFSISTSLSASSTFDDDDFDLDPMDALRIVACTTAARSA